MLLFINAARLAIIVQTESCIFRTANNGSLENVEERACSYFEAGADCVLISSLEDLTSVTQLTGQLDGAVAISNPSTACPI